jgi:hypothetical protein
VNELAFVIPFHYFRRVIGPVDAEPPALREMIDMAEFGVELREKVMKEIRRWGGGFSSGPDIRTSFVTDSSSSHRRTATTSQGFPVQGCTTARLFRF